MIKHINFEAISKIPFKDVLTTMNIPYTIQNNKLQCDGFTVDLAKNLFWATDVNRGNVINFVAWQKQCKPYQAAEYLENIFLNGNQATGEKPEPTNQTESEFSVEMKEEVSSYRIIDAKGNHVGDVVIKQNF
jgi:hypothetical protein